MTVLPTPALRSDSERVKDLDELAESLFVVNGGIKDALKLYDAEVKRGNVYAAVRLGDLYGQKNKYMQVNNAKAMVYYKKAVEMGSIEAGKRYWDVHPLNAELLKYKLNFFDMNEALENSRPYKNESPIISIKKLADVGYPPAQFVMARVLEGGLNDKMRDKHDDPKTAAKYLKKACSFNNLDAIVHLGKKCLDQPESDEANLFVDIINKIYKEFNADSINGEQEYKFNLYSFNYYLQKAKYFRAAFFCQKAVLLAPDNHAKNSLAVIESNLPDLSIVGISRQALVNSDCYLKLDDARFFRSFNEAIRSLSVGNVIMMSCDEDGLRLKLREFDKTLARLSKVKKYDGNDYQALGIIVAHIQLLGKQVLNGLDAKNLELATHIRSREQD